ARTTPTTRATPGWRRPRARSARGRRGPPVWTSRSRRERSPAEHLVVSQPGAALPRVGGDDTAALGLYLDQLQSPVTCRHDNTVEATGRTGRGAIGHPRPHHLEPPAP